MDGHPDWGIDLTTGETKVDTSADSAISQPEPAAPSADHGQPAAAPPAPPSDPMIPKYRLDQVNERAAEVARENQELREMLKALAARPVTVQPSAPAPVPNEADQAYQQQTEDIRQEFFKRFPEMQTIMDRWESVLSTLDRIAPVADVVPQMQERENKYWGTVAQNTLTTAQQEIAKSFNNGTAFPAGSPALRQINSTFFEWTNGSPDRVARYEANDPTLVKEFVQYFGEVHVSPWRGSATPGPAPRVAQAQRIARLPVSGSSGIPAPQPPHPTNGSEDAVHSRAWDVIKSLREAVGR